MQKSEWLGEKDGHPSPDWDFQNLGDGLSLLHRFQFFIILYVLFHDLLSCISVAFCHFESSQGGTNNCTESCPKIKSM